VLCRIKARWVVEDDDGVEARFLWNDLVLSNEDPLFSLVPHAGYSIWHNGISILQYAGVDVVKMQALILAIWSILLYWQYCNTINFHGP
jgi:hypothetical protein